VFVAIFVSMGMILWLWRKEVRLYSGSVQALFSLYSGYAQQLFLRLLAGLAASDNFY
jgi:hypothetical protein